MELYFGDWKLKNAHWYPMAVIRALINYQGFFENCWVVIRGCNKKMKKKYLVEQDVREEIKSLKEKFANNPSKLKIVEAAERVLDTEKDSQKLYKVYKELIKFAKEDEQIENPIGVGELEEISGFAKLLLDIKEYESDTFSSSTSEITDSEILSVANKLVDYWNENYLDGGLIYDFLEGIREDDISNLELRGTSKGNNGSEEK